MRCAFIQEIVFDTNRAEETASVHQIQTLIHSNSGGHDEIPTELDEYVFIPVLNAA